MAERIVVVGAGLSGLAAAYRLQQAGKEVVVLERNAVVGGCAATELRDGYVVDTGCDLINSTFVRYLGLAREVGLGDRIVRSAGAADFVRDGRAVTIDPRRPDRALRSPLLSPRSKLRAATGFARLAPALRRFDAYAMTQYDADAYGTAEEFVAKYFNDEIGSRVFDPLVRAFTGTGLQHATGLSVMATLAVGAAPALAVRGGMIVLPQTLAERLDVCLNTPVTAVEETGDGVRVQTADDELRADACVLAVSHAVAADLWPELPEAGHALRDLQLISVSLGYDAPSPTNGMAILIPTRESSEALLGFHQQNKAPDRAPAGRTLVTVYTDGSVTADFMGRTDTELADWAGGLLEGIYPSLRGRREMTSVTRWSHTGYMQFPGFWEMVKDTQKAIADRRVRTTSALFGSGGVEHAVVGGERAAKRLLEFLARIPVA